MALSKAEKLVANLGFVSVQQFIIKFAMPIVLMCSIFFIMTFLFFTNLPRFMPYLIIVFGLGFIFLYPVVIYEKRKTEINENIHLMITYAGTISTADIQRNLLFKRLSEKKRFGEISESAEKILYFSKSWNLGYAAACRRVSAITPSRIFGDFLDRFAVMMDFGEDLKIFLNDEQDAVMDDFSAEYNKSLENIKMLQEVFVSITIAVAFIMSIALLLPLIAGTPIDFVVKVSLMSVVLIDIVLFVLVYSFIPQDRLLHTLPIKSEGMKKIERNFLIFLPISLVFTAVLLYADVLPFLFNFAVGLSPLMIVGVYAQQEENLVFTRDKAFPSFIRALGAAIEIKMGAIISSLHALRVHDFGVLNNLAVNLYRRLRLGNDKYKSWLYYAAESGSNLIYHFSQIFAESIYLGGNAEKIGEIVSKNFLRLISLRKLRLQLAASTRGAFYGSLVGFCSAAYISAKITQMLAVMFSSPLDALQADGGVMASVIGSIAPTEALSVNMQQITVYIGIMVLVHSIMSALVIKIIDGGDVYACFFDFIVMLWIGAMLSYLIPVFMNNLLPSFTQNLNASVLPSAVAGAG
jgi:flagellar protein FlaJ